MQYQVIEYNKVVYESPDLDDAIHELSSYIYNYLQFYLEYNSNVHDIVIINNVYIKQVLVKPNKKYPIDQDSYFLNCKSKQISSATKHYNISENTLLYKLLESTKVDNVSGLIKVTTNNIINHNQNKKNSTLVQGPIVHGPLVQDSINITPNKEAQELELLTLEQELLAMKKEYDFKLFKEKDAFVNKKLEQDNIDKEKRKEVDKQEQRHRQFMSNVSSYNKIKEDIVNKKLSEDKISPLFKDKYPILKCMDEDNLLSSPNAEILFYELYDELNDDTPDLSDTILDQPLILTKNNYPSLEQLEEELQLVITEN
jgi:hypothetical protein